MSVKRTGGGRFDPDEGSIYFMAGNFHFNSRVWGVTYAEHMLVALNDVMIRRTTREGLVAQLKQGCKVALDSGVFSLANKHAEAHGISMDQALLLHPSKIDGFEELWEAYIYWVKRHEPDLWGYVELDQGGVPGKRETRARLEAEGLIPMPVYHPLVDGWDYFDEIASQYDRICLGNVVQATVSVRERILATVWERKRRYPHLWIHVLGMTPSEILGTYPFNSADSSSMTGMARWGMERSPVGLSSLKDMAGASNEYRWAGSNYRPIVELMNASSHFITHAWRSQEQDMSELCDQNPPLEPWEGKLR